MKYLTILLLCLSLYSCNESEKHKVTRLVKKWQNKEIRFPEKIIFTQYATDTIKYKIDSAKFKILVYVDSLGCSRCEMRLSFRDESFDWDLEKNRHALMTLL